METLDRNAMEELAKSVQACSDPFQGVLNCPPGLHQLPCTSPALLPKCNIPQLGGGCDSFCWKHCWTLWHAGLTEGLKACSGEFYARCPGFERIERVCEFEPAIEAAKFKEQAQLDRIAKLEARVKELELKK